MFKARKAAKTRGKKARISKYFEKDPMRENMSNLSLRSQQSREAERVLVDIMDMENYTRDALKDHKDVLEIGPSDNPMINRKGVLHMGPSAEEMKGFETKGMKVFADVEEWKGRKFDAVTSRLLFPFIADHKGFVRKLSDLVKPGGRLVLTENPWDNLGIARASETAPPHFKSISRRRLLNLLRKNGFEITHSRKGKSDFYLVDAKRKQ